MVIRGGKTLSSADVAFFFALISFILAVVFLFIVGYCFLANTLDPVIQYVIVPVLGIILGITAVIISASRKQISPRSGRTLTLAILGMFIPVLVVIIVLVTYFFAVFRD